MFIYDYRIRNYLHILKPSGRLNVLMALSLHANERNRCYPSQKLLAKETGMSVSTVNRAIHWLKDKGCLSIVPYHKRVDHEISLPVRQNVYQLTGKMKLEGEIIPYMYTPPRDKPDYTESEAEPEPKDQNPTSVEVIPSEISPSKILAGKTKVSTSISESIQKKTTTTSTVEELVPLDEKPQQSSSSEKTVFELYGNRVESLNQHSAERIKDFVSDYGEELVREALRRMITVDPDKRKASYFGGMLERMHKDKQQELHEVKRTIEHQEQHLTNAQEKYKDLHVTGGVA